MIEIFISYQAHGSGPRKSTTYAIHIHIAGQPIWTTYISPSDYDTLDKAGIQKI